jgi:hypothetical protein
VAVVGILGLALGCKLTGQKINPLPYAETKKYVEAARAEKIKVSLAEFSAIAEKDAFEQHWKHFGWAGTIRLHKGKMRYEDMGDQACYSGYLTAGLVYNLLNDPTNKTKRAHLKKALMQHRVKTLYCGRRGYVPRGIQTKDINGKFSSTWKRCDPPYQHLIFTNKRGPSPGQYMGTMYGLYKAATLLKEKDPELAKLAKDTLQDIGDDLVATGWTLKMPDGFPSHIPFFLLRGPKIPIPGIGHVTIGSGKYKKTYVNLAEKYNLNCLGTAWMLFKVTGDPKFEKWYYTFVKEKRHVGVYKATIEIGKMRIGKGSSHLGTMAALEFLHPLVQYEGEQKEYEKAREVWWVKTQNWENALWYCAYYNMTKGDKKWMGEVVEKRLKGWSGLPRKDIKIVNSNRPDIKLQRKGISGYVAADPLPRCESLRTSFWPVKTPFKLDGSASPECYGALDFVMCYQYAKYLGLVE